MSYHIRQILSNNLTSIMIVILGVVSSPSVLAYVANISPASRMIYLRVGNGAFTTSNYNNAGSPQNGGGISEVSITVPANQVGNNTEQTMTGNGALISNLDGYVFCSTGQIYVGGFYRINSSTAQNATLRVSTPINLTSSSGDTLPISQIRWTSSGIGDSATTAQPIPAGTFTGGSQILSSTFTSNQWRESCHTFIYKNQTIVPAGTYTARAVYTLASP